MEAIEITMDPTSRIDNLKRRVLEEFPSMLSGIERAALTISRSASSEAESEWLSPMEFITFNESSDDLLLLYVHVRTPRSSMGQDPQVSHRMACPAFLPTPTPHAGAPPLPCDGQDSKCQAPEVCPG